MIVCPAPHPLAARLRLARVLVLITGAVALVGCNPYVPPSSSAEASVSAVPTPASAGAPEAQSPVPAVGQTDTAWGRIWDGVPEAFPVYPGATPADEAAVEAVSATFALEGADARSVVGWLQTEMERATFATAALNGPLEDGGFVLESTGPSGCRIEVAVAPLGGLTMVGVRYGAACPAP